MFCVGTVLLFYAVSTCFCANILVYLPTPFYSHQVAYTNLWKTLTARGHKITIVTGQPTAAEGLHRIIDITEEINVLRRKYDVPMLENAGIFGLQPHITRVSSDILDIQLPHPEIQELIHNSTKFNFDLVITEAWLPEFLGFAKIYKCSSMVVVPIDSDVQGYEALGNPVHPILNHDMNLPVYGRLQFSDRVLTTIFHFYILFYYKFIQYPTLANIANRYFGNYTKVDQENFLEDAGVMLVNINPLLKGHPALGPNTLLVGGGNHFKPIEPLPQNTSYNLEYIVQPLWKYFGARANTMYSHQTAFAQLWRELSLRGHQLTVITTEPKEFNVYRRIDVSSSTQLLATKYNASVVENAGLFGVKALFNHLNQGALEIQLYNPEVQELIHNNTKYHFDLIITEVWNPELLAFAKIYNTPSDGIVYDALGNSIHPFLDHNLNILCFGKLKFWERLYSTIFHFYLILHNDLVWMPLSQKVLNKYFGSHVEVSVPELFENADVMLVNIHPVLKGGQAVIPNTIFVGGINQRPLKPLPQDMKIFLDGASEGFIYMSLGSNVQSKDLQDQTLKTIMDILRDLPFRILWKYESDDLPNVPKNVKLIKWAPQQDILRHPNIKLFISQGGLQSIEEAVFSHVPLIIMPFYGDQWKNAKLVTYREIGKMVSHKPLLNKDEFKDAILDVINNPKYKESVTRLAHLIQDQPMSGLELSVWWTEYLIRNKGAKHLRNPSGGIPFYQYYLLDVLGFFIFVIALSIWIFVLFLKCMVKVIKKTFRTKPDKNKKNV